MRINVYEEELGEGVEVIRKDNVNGNETFFGLRIWLKSPKEILDHSTPEDDDRTAITFWCKSLGDLGVLANNMAEAVKRAWPPGPKASPYTEGQHWRGDR